MFSILIIIAMPFMLFFEEAEWIFGFKRFQQTIRKRNLPQTAYLSRFAYLNRETRYWTAGLKCALILLCEAAFYLGQLTPVIGIYWGIGIYFMYKLMLSIINRIYLPGLCMIVISMLFYWQGAYDLYLKVTPLRNVLSGFIATVIIFAIPHLAQSICKPRLIEHND